MREAIQLLPLEAATSPVHVTSSVQMVAGVRNILAYQHLLQQLAQNFGQPTAMHGVEHFLRGAGRGMIPYLLLVLADRNAPITLALENILGAALLHEFQFLGIGSGIFVTEGKDGFRSIIAPAESRACIAAVSATAMLNHKAQIVVASYIHVAENSLVAPPPLPRRSFHWAAATRPAPGYLPLRDTLEQTIDLFNKKTRRNFRYYRRLLEAETALEFVANAADVLSLAELQALNRNSLEPVPDETMRRRHESFSHHPEAFLCGLRTQAGEWLSLLGGWRQDKTSALQWQLNLRGYERFSLVTITRSFWIEHEIALGSKVLRFDGGTAHAMNHAFIPENAVDLMLRRRSLRAYAMVKIVAPLMANRRVHPVTNNFLAKTLSHPGLRWYQQAPKLHRPAGRRPAREIASEGEIALSPRRSIEDDSGGAARARGSA